MNLADGPDNTPDVNEPTNWALAGTGIVLLSLLALSVYAFIWAMCIANDRDEKKRGNTGDDVAKFIAVHVVVGIFAMFIGGIALTIEGFAR